MFSLSIKQLIRTPVKVVIFILLLASVTMLMVFGSVLLVQTNAHIEQVEDTFTTIGMVEQLPSSTETAVYEDGCGNIHTAEYDVYDELLTLDALDFEGAGYILPPEDRRCYLAKAYINLEYSHSVGFKYFSGAVDSRFTIAEITPLEDCESGKPVKARVGQVVMGSVSKGGEINFCPHHCDGSEKLERGRTYIACMKLENCQRHGASEFVPVSAPYTSLYGSDGEPVDGGEFPSFHLLRRSGSGAWIKGRDFGGTAADMEDSAILLQEKGEGLPMNEWVDWAKSILNEFEYYPVIATNSLTLMPSFQSKNAQIADGRAITQEEFDSGALVCMVPDDWNFTNNDFVPGEMNKLVLPMSMTLEGYPVGRFNTPGGSGYSRPYSFIDENGKRFSTFSQGSYTIVGTYTVKDKSFFGTSDTELAANTIIIPAKSVEAPDSNVVYRGPLSSSNVSFQIPNGSIASFDKKLREAVPEAELLSITYDDNGYEEIMPSLQRTRTMAVLLCAVGAAGAAAVVLLLLYFFIAKENRRTAIERGLGMTKRQCYISLMSGILVLALIGTMLGSVLGLAMIGAAAEAGDASDQEGMYSVYSTLYSDWTNKWNQVSPEQEDAGTTPPLGAAAIGVPAALMGLIFVMGMVMAGKNLRVEPVLVLGGRYS